MEPVDAKRSIMRLNHVHHAGYCVHLCLLVATGMTVVSYCAKLHAAKYAWNSSYTDYPNLKVIAHALTLEINIYVRTGAEVEYTTKTGTGKPVYL